MFDKYIFSDDLRIVISHFIEEGLLNEGNYENIVRETITRKVYFLSTSLVFFLGSFFQSDINFMYGFWFFSSVFFIFSFLSFFTVNKFSLPYSAGVKSLGHITGVHYDHIPAHGYRGWCISYSFQTEMGDEYSGSQSGIDSFDLGSESIKIGDPIDVYYLESNPVKNALHLKKNMINIRLKRNLNLCLIQFTTQIDRLGLYPMVHP